MHDFELLVIGSGPGGQKAAIAAAKLDRQVAVIERPDMLGGVRADRELTSGLWPEYLVWHIS